MITEPISVYLHVPYCIKKCNYCDFCSVPEGKSGVPEAYIERLTDEISAYKSDNKIPASTLYFGGGTPSLLTPKQLEKILSALDLVFDFQKDFEFTIEANPGTVTEEKLRGFNLLGANRLSIGMQSKNASELLALGRIHTHGEFAFAFAMAKNAGFQNISCDVMYGIPYQTKESFKDTLTSVIELNPEHVSVYGLMIEEGTPFYKAKDTLPLPTEDEECEMYYLADKLLSDAGYTHYEISNYAHFGKESQHNLKYWHAGEYLGFGASAASYYLGKRFVNTDDISEYLSHRGASYKVCDTVSSREAEFEYSMLALRLKEGISFSDYREKFGKDFKDGRGEVIDKLLKLGLISLDENSISLTTRGFYVSNSILCELL